MELIRDTAFGQLVRLVTRNKVFQFPEERDPAFGDKYINLHKSRSMVEHGTTNQPVEQQTQQKPDPSNAQASEESIERRTTQPTEQSSAPLEKETEGASPVGSLSTLADEDLARQPTAPDPEKGRDVDIVDWWGPEDPEVSSNKHETVHLTLTSFLRILATGPLAKSSLSLSKYASLPSLSTLDRRYTLLASLVSLKSLVSVVWLQRSA